MIVSKISCGLGNQMFQYATGYALAKRAGLEFRLDTSWFDSPSADRDFLLRGWSTLTPEADQFPPTFREARNLFYQSIPRQPAHLVGYWQTERYFADAKKDLLELFQPRRPVTVKDYTVAVHVRRGDRVGGRWDGITPVAYYADAIKAFRSRLNSPSFSVWSDDPEWATRHLPSYCTIQPMGPPVHDLWAMSRCSHQIIGNSSYSWWAAWLNPNPNKRVIWPDRLSSNHPPVTETDYIPKSWLQT